MLKRFPWLQPFWYWMVTEVLIEVIEPVVKPVVRPLFMTARPIVGAWIVVQGTPTSRIAPLESTFARAVEIAASTFPVPSGTMLPVKSPTMLLVAPEQLVSIKPGWSVSSPDAAVPDRARMWLLERIDSTPSRRTR